MTVRGQSSVVRGVMGTSWSGLRLRLACSALALLPACTATTAPTSGVTASSRPPVIAQDDVAGFTYVDCQLPGAVIRNGMTQTRVLQGRLVRETARECGLRGGRYILADRASLQGSLDAWRPLAEQGDAEAQNYLAELYERGANGQPDYQLARLWYGRAADQGLKTAQFNLARFYDEGLGGPADPETAAKLYYDAMGLDPDLRNVVTLVDETELAFLRSSLEERDAMLAAQQQMIADLSAQVAQLKAERDALLDEVSLLDRDLSALRLELARAMQTESDQRSALRLEMERLNSERSELSAADNALAEREAALIARETALLRRIGQSEADNSAEIEALVRDLEEANAKITDRTRERDAAKASEAEAVRRVAAIESQLDAQLRATAERESILATQEAALAQRESMAEADSTDLSDQRAELTTLRAEMNRARETLEAQRQALSNEQESLDAQRIILSQLEYDLSTERDALNAQAGELQSLSLSAADLAAEREALQAERRLFADQQLALEQERAELEDSLEATALEQAALERQAVEVAIRLAEIESRESDSSELRARVAAAEIRAEAAEASQRDVQEQLDAILSLLETARGRDLAESEPEPLLENINVDFGTYHAVLIGNENYENPGWGDLITPHEDVDRIAELLEERYGFESPRVLKDANKIEIHQAISEVTRQLGPNDNLLIYFAGHGQQSETGRASWEPIDSIPNEIYLSVDVNWINDTLQITDARKVLIIADSCYSGSFARGPTTIVGATSEQSQLDRAYQQLAEGRSRSLFASGNDQPVADGGGGRYSIFAAALIRALSENNRIAPAPDIYATVRQQVIDSEAGRQLGQEPQFANLYHASHEGGEFLFVPSR